MKISFKSKIKIIKNWFKNIKLWADQKQANMCYNQNICPKCGSKLNKDKSFMTVWGYVTDLKCLKCDFVWKKLDK